MMKRTLNFGRYQTLRKLAAGGMAEVHLAQLTGAMGFSKTVVVKRIHAHLAEDAELVEMFRHEALLAAKLSHPNLVHIHDFGIESGSPYLVMEHVDGPSLSRLLSAAGAQAAAVPPRLAARIVSLACEGLHYAHDLREPLTDAPLELVHRDVSLENILVARNGTVKVVDFGIARVAGQIRRTRPGMVRGKMAYMSPEQIRGEPIDRRTDVFALGVCLYALLTGQLPFDGDSQAMLMHRLLFSPPRPLASLRPGLPPSLQAIIDRALAKAAVDRYPDCRELQQDLERYIATSPELVSSGSLAELVRTLDAHLMTSAAPGAPAGHAASEVTAASSAGETAPSTPPAEPTAVIEPASPTATVIAPPARDASGWKWAALVASAALGLFALVLWIPGSVRSPAPAPSAPAAPERSAAPAPPPPQPDPTPAPNPAPTPAPAPALRSRPTPARPAPRVPLPPAAAPSKAHLKFWIRPFAIVSIDGKELGPTPMPPVELTEGLHRIVLRNPELNLVHEEEVLVRGDQVFKYSFGVTPP